MWGLLLERRADQQRSVWWHTWQLAVAVSGPLALWGLLQWTRQHSKQLATEAAANRDNRDNNNNNNSSAMSDARANTAPQHRLGKMNNSNEKKSNEEKKSSEEKSNNETSNETSSGNKLHEETSSDNRQHEQTSNNVTLQLQQPQQQQPVVTHTHD